MKGNRYLRITGNITGEFNDSITVAPENLVLVPIGPLNELWNPTNPTIAVSSSLSHNLTHFIHISKCYTMKAVDTSSVIY